MDSKEGKGSTFTLQFPTTIETASPITTPKLKQETKDKKLSILVVDDEEFKADFIIKKTFRVSELTKGIIVSCDPCLPADRHNLLIHKLLNSFARIFLSVFTRYLIRYISFCINIPRFSKGNWLTYRNKTYAFLIRRKNEYSCFRITSL